MEQTGHTTAFLFAFCIHIFSQQSFRVMTNAERVHVAGSVGDKIAMIDRL